MIHVLIADGHPIVRAGLRHVLAAERGLKVVAEAGRAQQLRKALGSLTADVLVLDLDLPDGGLDIVEEVHRLRPELKVVIFSALAEDICAVRVLRAGAAAYLHKGAEPDELVRAVRKVHGGGRYLTPGVAEVLADAVSGRGRAPHGALRDREFEVLRLLGAGKTVSEAAGVLHLSVKTVSSHRARVLRKLRLRNNAELILYALRNGLL
jgi:DNA-binding NarL/FixJ family response regulator